MAQFKKIRIPATFRRCSEGRLYLSIALIACLSVSGISTARSADQPRKRTANSSEKKSADSRQARKKSDSAAKEHPLTKPIRIVRQSLKKLEGVQNYTATFSKKERVGRRGSKLISQTMSMKFREKPFSVYFYFQDRKTRGREVLYVSGRNQGKLLAHEGSGLAQFVTVSLATNSNDVMKENRYPITEVGLKNMAKKIIEQWEGESKYGETTVKYYNNAKLGSVECLAIESTHPQPRRQFRSHMTRVYIDKKTRLLVRVEQYGWPNRAGQQPPIIEEYTYSNINTNAGLTDFDFDSRNKSYNF